MAQFLINLGFPHQMSDITVVTPDYLDAEKNGFDREKKLPVLWLLHDFGGNSNDWVRFGQIENIVRDRNMIVVMPSGGVSYYVEADRFQDFHRIIMMNVWEFVIRSFPASDRREDQFVAGNGMGGYGALYYAFRDEGRFAAAAALDGDLNAPERFRAGDMTRFVHPRTFAEDKEYDLAALAAAAQGEKPALYLYSGAESPFGAEIDRKAAALENAGAKVVRRADGDRSGWALWQCQLTDFLDSVM